MRAFSGASALALTAVVLSTSVACSQVGQVQAKRDFKAANTAYVAQDYVKASQLYESVVKSDPNLNQAYFYLGNSYDNQFRPSRRGEPANDAFLDKAVANYQICADRLANSENPDDKKLAVRSLEYLQAAYGADKLNDPAKAEPIVQQMIRMDPGEASNYFVLAKIYEDAGVYDAAEQTLINARNAKPSDPAVYMTLAGFYNRQGQFDKTIEALEARAKAEPNNPDAFQTIAAYYWDETRGDASLTQAQKLNFVQKGLAAVDQAITMKPDFIEAVTFKGLLLRQQALLEKDPAKQQALIKEATALSEKANDLQKQKTGRSN
ncbi:MAG: tetratricopeptide repeat protein [Acidobacteriaceae bacterium]|jgi:tetratricopeptide (TPR) repeat protein|nr:tetratricopeptide repeat protein [Acidobacteriaceae bacterium]